MQSPVSLRYPNGRLYHTLVNGNRPVAPGDSFALFGREWRAIEPASPHGRARRISARILCVPV